MLDKSLPPRGAGTSSTRSLRHECAGARLLEGDHRMIDEAISELLGFIVDLYVRNDR
jgi:hypothetical protein